MKAVSVKIIPFIVVFTAGAVFAQHESGASFESVDKNHDGVLSISEATDALPDISIKDSNEDGIFNKGEAENAVAGLVLTPNNQGDGSGPVREPEYRMIVKKLTSNSKI